MPITPDIFNKILEEIAHSELSLTDACKKHGTDRRRFYELIKDDKDLQDKYARAKDLQMEYFADQIITIADDSSLDAIPTEHGVIENKEFVNRSRLKIDARKWIMAKRLPKKYGDKLDLTSDGEKLPSQNIQPIIQVITSGVPFGDSPTEEIEQKQDDVS